MTTYDSLAVDVLLDSSLSAKQRRAKLTVLAAEAQARLEGRVECPECGHEGPHDDNGQTGAHLGYCCVDCGCHFDAEDLP